MKKFLKLLPNEIDGYTLEIKRDKNGNYEADYIKESINDIDIHYLFSMDEYNKSIEYILKKLLIKVTSYL